MAADVQSRATLAGWLYIDDSANPRSGSCIGQLEPISSRTAVGLFGTVKLGLGRCFGLFGSNINRIPIDEKEPNPL